MAPISHSKVLSHPVPPHLISIAPTLDLVAAVTADDLLEVFRFDGQRAFIYRRGASLRIESLSWRPDGMKIALAWSNGEVQNVEVRRGKVVQHFLVERPIGGADRIPTALGWGANLVDPVAANMPPRAKRTVKGPSTRHEAHTMDSASSPDGGDELTESYEGAEGPTLEDFTAYVTSADVGDNGPAPVDLPNTLAQIAVESELPRLSALAAGDDTSEFDFDPELFTSQELLDQALAPYEPVGPTYTVDSLLVALGNGRLVAYLFGDYLAGDIKAAIPAGSRLVSFASHPFASSHGLLVKDKSGSVGLQSVDLDALRLSKHFLPLVCRQTASLKVLSQYITQTVLALRSAWAGCQDLPRRWIEMGQDDVRAGDKMDLVPALYSLAMTGDCTPALKDWLVHSIGDRNYKRWDQAASTNYQQIINLAQRHLLPALDHASVRASRLRALARTPNLPIYHADERHLTRVLNDLDILRLLAHRLVLHARLEAQQFHVFSTWLKHMVALHTAEPNSQTAEDAAERAAAVNHSTLLQYLTEALTKSRLPFFLARPTSAILDAPHRPAQQVKMPFLVQILDRHADKLLQPAGNLPEVTNLLYQSLFLLDSVCDAASVVVAGFTKNTYVSPVHALDPPIAHADKTDLRLVCTGTAAEVEHTAYILVLAQGAAHLYAQPLGTSSATRAAPLPVARGEQVKDQRFLDDDEYLVLVDLGAASELRRVAYRATQSRVHTVARLGHDELGWTPASLALSKEKYRARVLVQSEDGRVYTVLVWSDWREA